MGLVQMHVYVNGIVFAAIEVCYFLSRN